MRLDDLCDSARATRSGTGEIPSLVVADEAAVAPAMGQLVTYFGEDPAREEVGLVARGTFAGYLHRGDLAGMVFMQPMGLGTGDLAFVPGDGYLTEFAFACPQPGCERRRSVFFPDPDDPPRCPDHRSVAMTRVK